MMPSPRVNAEAPPRISVRLPCHPPPAACHPFNPQIPRQTFREWRWCVARSAAQAGHPRVGGLHHGAHTPPAAGAPSATTTPSARAIHCSVTGCAHTLHLASGPRFEPAPSCMLAPAIHSLPRTTLPKSMAASDPESLAAVDGFTLSHRGVGSLRWLVPVDVRGLELDKIAHIQQGEGRATGLLGGMQKQASKQLPHASSHRPRRCLAAPPHPCDPPHPFPIPCNPPLTAPR
jgi:hypothetical protein